MGPSCYPWKPGQCTVMSGSLCVPTVCPHLELTRTQSTPYVPGSGSVDYLATAPISILVVVVGLSGFSRWEDWGLGGPVTCHAGVVPTLRAGSWGACVRRGWTSSEGEPWGGPPWGPHPCSQEAVLWCGTGEPEFQVLWRISLLDLLGADKEDLDGISLQWGFCLSESCRTGPGALGRHCVIPAHPTAVTSHTLLLYTRSEHCIWKTLWGKRLRFVLPCENLYIEF